MILQGRVLAFSRNLPYRMGGAELSLYEELKSVKDLVICYAPQSSGAIEIEGYQSIVRERLLLKDAVLFNRFFYLEYFKNRKVIERALNEIDFDCLVAQNRWAPKAVLEAKKLGKTAFVILRDESSIHPPRNYYSGVKRLFRSVYSAVESRWVNKYYKENLLALRAADKVYANSFYMQEKLWDFCRVDSDILIPKIDLKALKSDYNIAVNECPLVDKSVIMIGDTYIKGVHIFRQLAMHFPNVMFEVFGKGQIGFEETHNLKHSGWVSNSAAAYARAKVVVVPSVWDEAYGRVAVEANYLGIPTIVSNVGGLPEAVSFNKELIAFGVEEFISKLERLL